MLKLMFLPLLALFFLPLSAQQQTMRIKYKNNTVKIVPVTDIAKITFGPTIPTAVQNDPVSKATGRLAPISIRKIGPTKFAIIVNDASPIDKAVSASIFSIDGRVAGKCGPSLDGPVLWIFDGQTPMPRGAYLLVVTTQHRQIFKRLFIFN